MEEEAISTGNSFFHLDERGRITSILMEGAPLDYEANPQAILSGVQFGEETSDDYAPGTILLGVRSGPEAPWVVARNVGADSVRSEDGERVRFRYDFGIVEEIEGAGEFAPVPHPTIPLIRWTLKLRNRSRRSLEIGELGFPFAFDNLMAPAVRSDAGAESLLRSRFHLHPFAGGAASFLFASLAAGTAPGLLVLPRGEAGWEFSCTLPASLRTPLPWEGIPVMYVHSRATVEREEWPEWFNGHTSSVLEPGEERVYVTDFAPLLDPFSPFDVAEAMAALGRPGVRFRPSAVAPVSRGVGFEVTGVRPVRYWTDREGARMEVDSTSDGGACHVRHPSPGSIRVSFEDEHGGVSHVHALLVGAPEKSLARRAARLARPGRRREEEATRGSSLEVTSLLGDALLLATLAAGPGLPTAAAGEGALARLLGKAVDPAELGVAAFLERPNEEARRSEPRRPIGHASLGTGLVLAAALDRLARALDDPKLARGARRARARALLAAEPSTWNGATAALGAEAIEDEEFAEWRAEGILPYRYPFFAGGTVNASGVAEAIAYAMRARDAERVARYCRIALAARSPAPAWWAYGLERRIGGPFESGAAEEWSPVATDRGGIVPAPWTAANSATILRAMAAGFVTLREGTLLLLEAGLWGPMLLLRPNGEATMGFSPDAASASAGEVSLAGDASLALAAMLDAGTCVVLRAAGGLVAVGAEVNVRRASIRIEPTLPACREALVPFLGVAVRSERANLAAVELSLSREAARIEVVAWGEGGDLPEAVVSVEGLWGTVADGSRRSVPLGPDGRGTIEFLAESLDDPLRRDAPIPRAKRFRRAYPPFMSGSGVIEAASFAEEDPDDYDPFS